MQRRPEKIEVDTGKVYENVEASYGPMLQAQLNSKDLNGAHITWNKMAEICIRNAQGDDMDSTIEAVERQWNRGPRPTCIQTQRIKLADSIGGLVVHRQQEIDNRRNKLADMRYKIKEALACEGFGK